MEINIGDNLEFNIDNTQFRFCVKSCVVHNSPTVVKTVLEGWVWKEDIDKFTKLDPKEKSLPLGIWYTFKHLDNSINEYDEKEEGEIVWLDDIKDNLIKISAYKLK